MSNYNQPLSGNAMPRFGGIGTTMGTMMRLPSQLHTEGLDACFVGIPMDIGSSHKSGARFGPKAIRAESAMIRPYHMAHKISPFDHLQIADIGDIAINTFDLKKSVGIIEKAYDAIIQNGCVPLTLGGDHTLTLPILRSIHKKYGKVALVHVDAHADINDTMFGEAIAHGTTFKRAYDEGLLEPTKVTQIGLRGTGYGNSDFDWSREQGFRVVTAEDCWHQSLIPLMKEVTANLGNTPVYFSFDIDGVDPAYAPGTGTQEIGGLTSIQAIELIRGCVGANFVGFDLVEVSPPYDHGGITANLGANLLYEMLCTLALSRI